jgi:hypothetical protein
MVRRKIGLAVMISLAGLAAGCDSNPEAPSAPSNIIVSDSDGPAPSQAPVKAKAKTKAAPIE